MGIDGFITIGGVRFSQKDVASYSTITAGKGSDTLYEVKLNKGPTFYFPWQRNDEAKVYCHGLDVNGGIAAFTSVFNCHDIKIFGTNGSDMINAYNSSGVIDVSGDEHNKDEVFIDKDSDFVVSKDLSDQITDCKKASDDIYPLE